MILACRDDLDALKGTPDYLTALACLALEDLWVIHLMGFTRESFEQEYAAETAAQIAE